MSSERAVFDGARKIASDLSRGAYSSREIVRAFSSRIERFDSQINAVVVRRFDEALKEADAADVVRASGGMVGPLHGVPITIKECFDFAGLPSTYGHLDRANHKARADAVTVSRLRAAGAIVLGKTNVPKDLSDWESYNDVYGHTRNPWDLNKSPGGSAATSEARSARRQHFAECMDTSRLLVSCRSGGLTPRMRPWPRETCRLRDRWRKQWRISSWPSISWRGPM